MSKEGHRDEKTLDEMTLDELIDERYRLITEIENQTRRHDAELEDQYRRIEELTRRHNMEIEELDRRLDPDYLLELENLWISVSLYCPLKLELISILQCKERLKSRECIEKDCFFRLIWIAYFFY